MPLNITETGSIMKNTWVEDLKGRGEGEVTSEGQEVNVPHLDGIYAEHDVSRCQVHIW